MAVACALRASWQWAAQKRASQHEYWVTARWTNRCFLCLLSLQAYKISLCICWVPKANSTELRDLGARDANSHLGQKFPPEKWNFSLSLFGHLLLNVLEANSLLEYLKNRGQTRYQLQFCFRNNFGTNIYWQLPPVLPLGLKFVWVFGLFQG